MAKTVRIGGASGFWGDASMSTPQLLKDGKLDYIVYDYLAEITMSIMARARAKDPSMGYATDFVTVQMKHNLREIANQGVKIISNAGGVNPKSCAEAIRKMVEEMGLNLKVAAVLGDDLIDRSSDVEEAHYEEMFSGGEFPGAEKMQSINAYLGGFPVAKALAEGADIVVTGRCVDSAVTLGACIHEFGWKPEDYDKLAGGSLAGHILECGPQATGGNFTDWELSFDTVENIGYPIAEMNEDGSFVTTKPDNTGGLVNVGTVSEQMLYEIGDPQAYFLPDVVCDFSTTTVEQIGDNRVLVSNTTGHPAPDTYKVCSTYADGFRGGAYMTFYGLDASKKAEKYGEAVFKRARNILRAMNLADYSETSVEIIGAESQYGAAALTPESREVVMKIASKHPDAAGVGIMLKEATGLALATPPGLSGFAGTRSKPSPVVRLFSFLLPKEKLDIKIDLGDRTIDFHEAPGQAFDPASSPRPEEPAAPSDLDDGVEVPLVSLAWGRSGDKGDKANVGLIARKPEYLPYIWAAVTEEEVVHRYGHFLEQADTTQVERFVLPGSNSMNILMNNALGGGGVASIRNDPQAKGFAQLLLGMPIKVSKEIAAEVAA